MKKIQPAVKKETLHIAFGTFILAAIMVGIFALLGQFNITVIWGALLGVCFAVLNFFLLGLTVQKATTYSDEKRAKAFMQLSYSLRMLLTLGVALLGIWAPVFNGIATVLPLLFPRFTIAAMSIYASIVKNKRVGTGDNDSSVEIKTTEEGK
ncbi:MAG: ATP synthase subunit I [Oscillospiraceae bacterium]|nr:ATP synthase subunit I [Oscillospiraceae bacterium]